MPLPKPKPGEKKEDFLESCMADSNMNSEYPDNDQRYAVCTKLFEQKDSSTDDDEDDIEDKKRNETMNNIETRFFEAKDLNFRAIEEEGKRFLEGYASVFETKSRMLLENGKTFTEQIMRGAFDSVLVDPQLDTIFNFNHDRNKIIARTISGTLSLKSDERGLFFRAEIPTGVSYAEDVYTLVKRGDLFSNSFAFSVNPQDVEWSRDEDGNRLRTIKRVAGLYDVSLVVNAAYPNTSVAARSLEEIEAGEKTTENPKIYNTDTIKRRLTFLKLKINN